tara:strand:- start:475 stop:762 length:288 start_codon:yes stop_codon:yes gene_type:complete
MNIENTDLKKIVEPENELKNFLVEYVGNKLEPSDNHVTVEMIVETMAHEFPEFLMAVAEENWIRGYQQGLDDVESGQKLMECNNVKQKNCKLCKD